MKVQKVLLRRTLKHLISKVEQKLIKRQKKMISDHKKRMYDMRVFGLDWQASHQRRWEDNSPCWEDKCDCNTVKGTG
mgnify:CR=1 FL=1